MNKKFVSLAIIFLISILLAACGSSNDKSSASEEKNNEKTFTFRVTSALSPNHGHWEGFYKPWMEQVEKESDGRVKFEAFTSGELVEGGNEYDALQQGTVDIAAPLLPIYDPQRYPLSEVTMLPLVKSSPEIGAKAYKKLVESDVELKDRKTFQELEFGDNQLFTLPVATSQQYSLSTTGKEINSASDFKKLQIRTPSRVHEIFAKKVGINSVTMPTFDLYDAMSRGAVDGSFLFISDWTGYGFQDLFKYTVNLDLGHFSSLLAMNEEKWSQLPEDIQQIMIQAMEDNFDNVPKIWNERSEETIKETSEKGGVFKNLEDLNPEVQDTLKKGMEETWYDFIDLLNEQGEPGTEIAKLWRDLIVEEGGEVPEEIMNLE